MGAIDRLGTTWNQIRATTDKRGTTLLPDGTIHSCTIWMTRVSGASRSHPTIRHSASANSPTIDVPLPQLRFPLGPRHP
ncbi:MAG: hypothetical protein ACI91B_001976 [Planctomycetota bacterium]|jgi:hypothetical protein